MSRRITFSAAPALAALLTLSACSTGAHYADLSHEATADDSWPSSLPDYAADHLDPESSRLVGHDDGTSLYLATSTEPDADVCLLIYPDDESWLVGCGKDEFSVSGGGNATYLVRSDRLPGEGNAISENVYIVG